jgi:5-methylcytosine-specific restriction endonuclease McrA
MKRTKLKKVSDKQKIKIKSNVEETKKMWEFFYRIWENSAHNCESCGASLGPLPATYMFDHLLEKSKYPEFKFEKNNIFLCCLECHNSKSNGNPTIKHQEAINKARKLWEEYNEFKDRIDFENKTNKRWIV